MEISESIRGDIVEDFLFGDDSTLAGDDISLLESGITDSAGTMESSPS